MDNRSHLMHKGSHWLINTQVIFLLQNVNGILTAFRRPVLYLYGCYFGDVFILVLVFTP